MVININIKADVSSISLIDLYELIHIYQKNKKEVISFKGLKFKIEVNISMILEYVITELK